MPEKQKKTIRELTLMLMYLTSWEERDTPEMRAVKKKELEKYPLVRRCWKGYDHDLLNKLSEGGHPEDSINCIVMAPTRELAQQIDQQMEGFSYFMPVSSVAVYGGNDGVLFEQQKRGLTLGADVVIATPGRLIAHLSLGYVDLSRVSYFILDEADRMLDMGFYDDIMQIVKFLPKERQTIMFSATMPAKIQQLAKSILNNPAEVKLAVSKPAEKIVQAAYVCYENQN